MSFQDIEVEEFKAKMQEADTIVLDVRTTPELVEGKVPNSTMINFMEPDFADKVAELGKEKTYLIYCRSGNRSARACEQMEGMGFTKLYNLVGGIHAWNADE